MDDVKIIDNFLNREDFLKVQSIFLSNNFPWFYHDNISGMNESSLGDFGFGHLIFQPENQSTLYPIILPLLEEICKSSGSSKLLKARADMTVFSTYGHRHQIHLDMHEPHTVSILYLTNSDAETIIYKDVNVEVNQFNELCRIKPEENKLVIFNGSYYHTGHSPASANRRVLLNVNSI